MTGTGINIALIAEYYCRHRDELLAYMSICTNGSSGSEDMVQDIFLKLLRSDRMISATTLPGLVHSMARNMVVDYWRHRASVAKFESYVRLNSSAHDSMDPLSIYASGEMMELLERGMARLSPKSRRIYAMNMMGGMQVSEISKMLSERYKSVENRLGAARKEMRRYMRKMLA